MERALYLKALEWELARLTKSLEEKEDRSGLGARYLKGRIDSIKFAIKLMETETIQ